MKTIAAILLALMLFAAPSFAAEGVAVAPTSTADVQQILDSLKGQPGLYGASGDEMTEFLGMVQTPELAAIVTRMNQQLQARGNTENMTLEEVSAFVAQNLTHADVEKLLGQSVTQEEYRQGVKDGTNPDNLQALVQMLQTK